MSAESVLYSALIGAAPVTAIVGTQIWADTMPEGTDPPSVVYGRTSTEYLTTIHGTVFVERAVLTVVCYAATREAAEALGNAVTTAALDAKLIPRGRSGDPPEEPIPGCFVTLAFEHLG